MSIKTPSIPGIFPMTPSDFRKTMSLYLDFHRNYLFRVMFFESGSLVAKLVDNARAIATTLLVSQTATPISRTEQIPIGWQGTKLKLAGKTEFADWKVTVRDDHLNLASDFFESWRQQVYSTKKGLSDISTINTKGYVTKTYKKSALVILLPSGNVLDSVATRAYLLNGIWPTEIGEVTLDYSTESIVTFPVTFAMDSYSPYSLTSALTSLIK